MTFPNQHRFPDGVPLWLLAGHELTAGERVAVTEYEQGEDRTREIRTFTHYDAVVGTKWLTQAQFDIFAEWFESNLQGGTLRFDCPIHSIEGNGVQWWEAGFAGPFKWQARSARYQVSANLRLFDGPYAGGTGPGTVGDTRVAPSMGGASIASSSATVSVDAESIGGWSEAEGDGQLFEDMSMGGWSEAEAEGTGFLGYTGYLLLPDGGYFLLPDGGRLGIAI